MIPSRVLCPSPQKQRPLYHVGLAHDHVRISHLLFLVVGCPRCLTFISTSSQSRAGPEEIETWQVDCAPRCIALWLWPSWRSVPDSSLALPGRMQPRDGTTIRLS